MITSSLQSRRIWIGGALVAAAVLAAAAWFLAISPELDSESALREQASNAQLENSTIAAKNAKLANQYAQISTLKSQLTGALAALPPDSGLPGFTRQLTAFAAKASVSLTSISVGSITPVSAPAATTGITGVGSTASAVPADTTTTPAPATPAGAATATATSQFSIDVTVSTTGSMARQIAFLTALRNGPRRVLITSTQLSVAAAARVSSVDTGTTMTSQLTIFSAPMSTAQLAQLQKISTGR